MHTFLGSLAQMVIEKNFWGIGASFLGGILVSLSPCIFPIIPIFLSLIVKASKEDKRKRVSFILCYILGLSIAFSILGIISFLLGKIFGFLFNYAITFIVLGNVFIVLGLWNLGIIYIPYRNREFTPGTKATAFFIMGILSAFYITPCMVPVLGAVLLVVSMKQDLFFGFFALFVFALGFSFPLLVMGVFSRAIDKFPRSGRWLNVAGKMIGIIFLVVSQLFFIKAGVLLCQCSYV